MTDELPLIDITNPKTFVIVAVIMILFGAMVGAGIYITFSGLAIPPDKGLAVIILLLLTSGVIGGFPYLYQDWVLKRGVFAPKEEDVDE